MNGKPFLEVIRIRFSASTSVCIWVEWTRTGLEWPVEMGRKSDFTIRPKPNIWPSSPNEYWILSQTSTEGCLFYAKWRYKVIVKFLYINSVMPDLSIVLWHRACIL